MKKIIILLAIFSMIFVSKANAYNPNSFTDQETISVNGNRPKVDITASEVLVNILAEDFIDSIATKVIQINNDGSVPCHLSIEINGVPVDLNVTAEVDNDFIHKNESTNLTITVELTDQQEVSDFNFTVVVNASLTP